MDFTSHEMDDSLQAILSELSNVNQQVSVNQDVSEEPDIILTRDDLEGFILKNGAKTVSTTQNIIATLLQQIQINPDAELIESVAEMIGSNNKALETLTKLHLNNEKLKQAKELETFKQSAKLQIVEKTQPVGAQFSREDIMQYLYNTDKTVKLINPEPKI